MQVHGMQGIFDSRSGRHSPHSGPSQCGRQGSQPHQAQTTFSLQTQCCVSFIFAAGETQLIKHFFTRLQNKSGQELLKALSKSSFRSISMSGPDTSDDNSQILVKDGNACQVYTCPTVQALKTCSRNFPQQHLRKISDCIMHACTQDRRRRQGNIG